MYLFWEKTYFTLVVTYFGIVQDSMLSPLILPNKYIFVVFRECVYYSTTTSSVDYFVTVMRTSTIHVKDPAADHCAAEDLSLSSFTLF